MNTPVSFELAKLLKEKGFGLNDDDYVQLPRFYEEDSSYIEHDVQVSRKYNPKRGHLGADTIEDFKAHLTMMDNSLEGIYLAPTIAEVVMWLYKKHDIWITVCVVNGFEFGYWIHRNSDRKRLNPNDQGKLSLNPTEAYEAAIKHTLNNLVRHIDK